MGRHKNFLIIFKVILIRIKKFNTRAKLEDKVGLQRRAIDPICGDAEERHDDDTFEEVIDGPKPKRRAVLRTLAAIATAP